MKHANKMTLILPEYLSLSQFEDIINLALKQAVEDYTTYQWDSINDVEKEVRLGINKYRLEAVATGNSEIIMEFEKNE